MKIIQVVFSILTICFLTSCATISMLPESAASIDFDAPEGKQGWSKYTHGETFHGYNPSQLYDALKVGLGNAGFSIRVADKSLGKVVGEHGMTLEDWNVIAGAYFKEKDNATKVMIIIEGSKDIGFSGDVTGDGWSGKILKGAREYLNSTYQSVLKVDKVEIK